jgi:hypothetical protein
VKLPSTKADELVRVDDEIDADQVVVGKPEPFAAEDVAERVGDEEDRQVDAAIGELGARSEPIAE